MAELQLQISVLGSSRAGKKSFLKSLNPEQSQEVKMKDFKNNLDLTLKFNSNHEQIS